MSLSVKKSLNSAKSTLKSLSNSSNKISKSNLVHYLAIIIIVLLTIGYFSNKYYNAIIFLYLITAVSYLLTKNLMFSLIISIVLTNFLISINFFMDNNMIKEGVDKTLSKINELKNGVNKLNKKENKNNIEDNKDKIVDLMKELNKEKKD